MGCCKDGVMGQRCFESLVLSSSSLWYGRGAPCCSHMSRPHSASTWGCVFPFTLLLHQPAEGP